MTQSEITPVPSDEEAVAIAAATEVLWPKPMVMAAEDAARRAPTWRFSGRWWAKPLAARRDRPFR
ncbi:MAG: hypothetical protein H6513_09840 [Acidimicrobiaceae bacterium]|mgnify:CR=1 FL=1|nr:hypothetical protein [Ilumatobacter sp.]MCB9380979.1 hypothetical protein [Acidimicrobiaceae bacterium]MCO5332232.1 hypothetical protein [Ilumatobacteraceae bacterium]